MWSRFQHGSTGNSGWNADPLLCNGVKWTDWFAVFSWFWDIFSSHYASSSLLCLIGWWFSVFVLPWYHNWCLLSVLDILFGITYNNVWCVNQDNLIQSVVESASRPLLSIQGILPPPLCSLLYHVVLSNIFWEGKATLLYKAI